MFWVYVLQNPAGRIYIGQTDDLDRRIGEHNSIEHNRHKYTSKFPGPWRLVYQEQYLTRSEVMKREKWLKSRSGRRFIESQNWQSGSGNAAGLTARS